jgi:citronellol/citronellal dehydrogenase
VIPQGKELLGGAVDILVNNAVAAVAVPITEVTAQQQRIAFECNVIAPLELAQAVIPDMRAAGAGGSSP